MSGKLDFFRDGCRGSSGASVLRVLASLLFFGITGCVSLGLFAGKLAFDLGRAELNKLLTASLGNHATSIPFNGAQVLCGQGSCNFPLRNFLTGSLGSAVASDVAGSFNLSHSDMGSLLGLMDRSREQKQPVEHQAGNGLLNCTASACHLAYQLKNLSDLGSGLALSQLIASAAQAPAATRTAR